MAEILFGVPAHQLARMAPNGTFDDGFGSMRWRSI